MSFSKEIAKLLTNKYFLYFMVFLAGTNILGYLVTNKINAVIFFGLVSFLTYQFSKNMSIVLLIGIISTNFLYVNKRLYEGLENQSDTDESPALNNIESKDTDIANAIPIVKQSDNEDDVKNKLKSKTSDVSGNVTDLNNMDLNKTNEDGPSGAGQNISTKKASLNENFGPRLDYVATIEQSYQNLDSVLGNDSIKQLSSYTQRLMSQQQNLFDTMNQMVPVLTGAQNMLKGFDLEGLTKSLGGMSAMASAPVSKTN